MKYDTRLNSVIWNQVYLQQFYKNGLAPHGYDRVHPKALQRGQKS